MPVPAPLPDVNVTLMSTIAGSTFCAMSDELRDPDCEPFDEGDGSAWALDDPLFDDADGTDPVAAADLWLFDPANELPTP
jgi:hypothetical protein